MTSKKFIVLAILALLAIAALASFVDAAAANANADAQPTDKKVKAEKAEKAPKEPKVKAEKTATDTKAKVEKTATETKAKVEKTATTTETAATSTTSTSTTSATTDAAAATKNAKETCVTIECQNAKFVKLQDKQKKIEAELATLDAAAASTNACQQAQVDGQPASTCTNTAASTTTTTTTTTTTNARRVKLETKLNQVKTQIAALIANGVDPVAVNAKLAADQAAQVRVQTNQKLEELWLTKRVQDGLVDPNAATQTTPVDKRAHTLLELTQFKVARLQEKLKELNAKIAWLQSNPEIPAETQTSATETAQTA